MSDTCHSERHDRHSSLRSGDDLPEGINGIVVTATILTVDETLMKTRLV